MPRNTCIPCHRRHAISVAANGSARKQRQPATSHRKKPTSSKVYNTNVHAAVTTQEVSVRRLTLPLRTPPASAAALVPIPPPFPCTLQPSPSPPLYSPPRPSSPTSPSFTPVASPSLLRQCTRCTKQLPLPPVASTPAPSQSLAYFPLPPPFPSALSSLYISEF